MKIKKRPNDFSICKVTDYSKVNIAAEYCFTGKTDEENSLVCLTEDVPANTLERDGRWMAFRIQGVLDFSLVGILSEITGILAEDKIGNFCHFHLQTRPEAILTKKEDYQKALDLLDAEGYKILE